MAALRYLPLVLAIMCGCSPIPAAITDTTVREEKKLSRETKEVLDSADKVMHKADLVLTNLDQSLASVTSDLRVSVRSATRTVSATPYFGIAGIVLAGISILLHNTNRRKINDIRCD